MTSRNEELFARAQRTIPGGVNSPVRAFRSVGGTPRFLKKALGARVWDADGKEYLDYVGSWGPAILGHADPVVVEAVRSAALDGLSFGAPTEREIEMAEQGRRGHRGGRAGQRAQKIALPIAQRMRNDDAGFGRYFRMLHDKCR